MGLRLGRGAFVCPPDAAILERLQRGGRRVHCDRPGLSVDSEQGAVGDVEQGAAGADDRGDTQRADQDRGVRGEAAEGAGHAENARGVEAGGFRRAQLGRHHDVLGALGGACAARPRVQGRPEQMSKDLLADAAQVRGPCSHVGVVQPIPCSRRRLHRIGPGARGTLALTLDSLTRGTEQRLVL